MSKGFRHRETPGFERFATGCAQHMGSKYALFLAFLTILAWGIVGPICKFSDTWQLVINTITTLITFLMVFLAQNDSNRNWKALHRKIDNLTLASDKADNSFMNLEEEPEDVLTEKLDQLDELKLAAELLNKEPTNTEEFEIKRDLFEKLRTDSDSGPCPIVKDSDL